ncbi:hypothetical protein ACFRCI_47590 [Streptomyces sp. NPDC056638]|uniref:hypothetical protein n=1 Tax=Streptomyces sp. NPDC056638 TaxID=3345887 RepID=UPI00367D4C8D
MTGDAVSRAREEASREDYASMARLARAMYGAGAGPREVIRECYGTEFPEEFFLFAETGPYTLDLTMDFTNQPWQLAVPLSQGGPPPEPDTLDRIERKVFVRDPRLVPLALPLDLDAVHGGRVICYHLDELRAGRPTTFGIRVAVGPDDETERCAASLLDVIHQHHADILRRLAHRNHLPSNRGTGAVDSADVEEARDILTQIEDLQHQVVARSQK